VTLQHWQTASRPLDDMSIRRSLLDTAQRDDIEALGSPNSKKDKKMILRAGVQAFSSWCEVLHADRGEQLTHSGCAEK